MARAKTTGRDRRACAAAGKWSAGAHPRRSTGAGAPLPAAMRAAPYPVVHAHALHTRVRAVSPPQAYRRIASHSRRGRKHIASLDPCTALILKIQILNAEAVDS
eukprot:scaffold1730_cov68-Phaeocystis_antarctica.AAC.9